MSDRYRNVPVACNNEACRDAQDCLRYEAWEKRARERVKRFNGSAEKGCAKFIHKPPQK